MTKTAQELADEAFHLIACMESETFTEAFEQPEDRCDPVAKPKLIATINALLSLAQASQASPDRFLRVIAEWPCYEQDDMQAANMRKVAREGLQSSQARTDRGAVADYVLSRGRGTSGRIILERHEEEHIRSIATPPGNATQAAASIRDELSDEQVTFAISFSQRDIEKLIEEREELRRQLQAAQAAGAREPLTRELVLHLAEQVDLARDYNRDGDVQSTRREDADITDQVLAFAQAIERFHGIASPAAEPKKD